MLERYHVKATFFVIGSHVTSWPGIVQQTVADGNEVGNHTFTHVDLSLVPEWRGKLELRLTEVARRRRDRSPHAVVAAALFE